MHSLTLWNAHAEVDAVDALRRSSEAGPYYCRYELDTRAEGRRRRDSDAPRATGVANGDVRILT